MPPKKHTRRNSLSEEEITSLMKAHAVQTSTSAYGEESDHKPSYFKQASDDKEERKQSGSKKTVSFGETTTIPIPNRDDIVEELAQTEHEEYIASIMLSLRAANNAPLSPNYTVATPDDTEHEEALNNTAPVMSRGRSVSFYIPPNHTLYTIDEREEDAFEEDDDLPFALNPNLEEGVKWTHSFIDHDKA